MRSERLILYVQRAESAEARAGEAENLLKEWLATEMDSMDEEFETWLEQFTKRIETVLHAAPPASPTGRKE